MQYAGSADEALSIAVSNGMGLTDLLTAGLQLPKPNIIYTDVVELYRTEKAIPASILSEGTNEGIGFWYLGNDFIVQ